jgi:hippurate hydrolase
MLDEGLLDVPPLADGTPSPISGAYALHTTAAMNTGWVSTRQGSIMASADTMLITVTGRGGHASEPFRALDPIPIACEIVQALQTMVTRRVDVFDPTVVTVGRISAGTTNNVIPETAEILGTIRAVSERTRSRVHDGIRRVAEGVAAAHEASVTVEIQAGYPVTVNGNDAAEFALGVAKEVAGHDKALRLPHPVMGAEDFSYVLQRVPGAMLFLGGTHPDRNPATAAPNHSNRVNFDEECMVTGMAMYTALAMRHLAAHHL